ncbi:HEPN-associated N-terminal domain-containing protein [Amycolatopsis kentuckyensis]|uniref:HEPN-associated N-terminal domain-containing protein n=1 Tax=Amycolatopsis kentuckyensis TaxID=218823 RepID=UPI0011785DD3|nr:HEPN-associated N-terminal domain-containing protein [Amycolatopsis kentuckyensis]
MEQRDDAGQWVCAACVDDYALANAITAAADAARVCSFCGKAVAAPLDVLVDAFVEGISNEYGDLDDEAVPYDSAEGGYQFVDPKDTWDIVEEFDELFIGPGLAEAVRQNIPFSYWTEKDWARPRRDEALRDSWARFSDAVRYETRYVFWLRRSTEDEEAELHGEVPAGRILDHVGALIDTVGLVRTLPAGTRFWRGRPHDERGEWTSRDLGTIPATLARQSNRMSPAGIPLFYGAENERTAIAEVARLDSGFARVTVGQFEISAPCRVVDFTRLPEVPSVFDPERGGRWREFSFLHEFVAQISRPVDKEMEQIEYVPTQIVTEYLLKIFRDGEADGILFRSAVNREVDVVLDVPNERCFDQVPDEPRKLSLRLVEGSMRTTDL